MKVEWLGSSDTEIKDLGFFLCSREELQHFKSRMKSKDWFTDYCRHSTSSTHSSHYSQNYRKWNPSSSAAVCFSFSIIPLSIISLSNLFFPFITFLFS